MGSAQRVVALVDLDCFYCAVERRRDPSLLGLPMAVVQYNPWENAPSGPRVVGGVTSRKPEEDRRDPLSNGSLIAVFVSANWYQIRDDILAEVEDEEGGEGGNKKRPSEDTPLL